MKDAELSASRSRGCVGLIDDKVHITIGTKNVLGLVSLYSMNIANSVIKLHCFIVLSLKLVFQYALDSNFYLF